MNAILQYTHLEFTAKSRRMAPLGLKTAAVTFFRKSRFNQTEMLAQNIRNIGSVAEIWVPLFFG